MDTVTHAYVDESGSLPDTNDHFMIAVVVSGDERHLKRIMRKVRRKMPRNISNVHSSSELKFANTTPRLRRQVLAKIASYQQLEIYVTAVNKAGRRITDTPEHYSTCINAALINCYATHHCLEVYLDIHFTRKVDRAVITQQIIHVAKQKRTEVAVYMEDSAYNPALQVADFVAGAFHYKYNHHSSEYATLIQRIIHSEHVVPWSVLNS